MFRWLDGLVTTNGAEALPKDQLKVGFTFQEHLYRPWGQRGITKFSSFPAAFSLRTSHSGPYDDETTGDSLISYRYQGKDPQDWDNVAMRRAYELQLPMLYLYQLTKDYYFAAYPTFILSDQPERLSVLLEIDNRSALREWVDGRLRPSDAQAAHTQRRYVTSATKVRMHQAGFRERVLRAYQSICCLCRIRHRELLDAAHIIPDSDPDGDPVTPNGLSMCKIHHAAFDSNIIGISPDYAVSVREDILSEVDGPMLRHGIQELNGSKLVLPRSTADHPDPERLARRFEGFHSAEV